jgi:hypothetical protein
VAQDGGRGMAAESVDTGSGGAGLRCSQARRLDRGMAKLVYGSGVRHGELSCPTSMVSGSSSNPVLEEEVTTMSFPPTWTVSR